MNPLAKPVVSVLRLLGAGLIVVSLVLLALLWAAQRRQPEPWWRWGLYSLPAAAGLVLCASSRKIAARFTQDFDE
jgi:hypothetical protein